MNKLVAIGSIKGASEAINPDVLDKMRKMENPVLDVVGAGAFRGRLRRHTTRDVLRRLRDAC